MKVLITEDDLMLADFLEEAVVELGHSVCGVAGDVGQAVALARVHRPDVAVIDMQLAGAELGSDIVDQLMASGDLGCMGILYVTGEADQVFREARPGHACLRKPYSMHALEAALAIVRDIAIECRTSRALPHGMRLLLGATTNAAPAGREVTAADERRGLALETERSRAVHRSHQHATVLINGLSLLC
jgi:DNA-binding response OmpR family regulator